MQVINERDILGTQLIRRNDELALLYEKLKIQQSTLKKVGIASLGRFVTQFTRVPKWVTFTKYLVNVSGSEIYELDRECWRGQKTPNIKPHQRHLPAYLKSCAHLHIASCVVSQSVHHCDRPDPCTHVGRGGLQYAADGHPHPQTQVRGPDARLGHLPWVQQSDGRAAKGGLPAAEGSAAGIWLHAARRTRCRCLVV